MSNLLCWLFGHKLYCDVIRLGQDGFPHIAHVMRCKRKGCDHIEDRNP